MLAAHTTQFWRSRPLAGPPAGRLLRGAGRVHHRDLRCRAAGAAAAGVQPDRDRRLGCRRPRRSQRLRDRPDGRPLDRAQRRLGHRPRVADGSRHRRRAATGKRSCSSTARSRGRSRCSSGTRPARSPPSRSRFATTCPRLSRTSSSSSRARTSPFSAAARTSSSPARSRASTSSRRPRTSPPATSRRRKTSSTC